MISKELKKLSRRELVDIIYQLKKNEQEMQEKIAELEEAVQEKRIRISVAGSIAEAAMDITNVFATAQTTADLYLQEISCWKEEAARVVDEANATAAKLLTDAEKQCAELKSRYQADYSKWLQLRAEIQALEKAKNAE